MTSTSTHFEVSVEVSGSGLADGRTFLVHHDLVLVPVELVRFVVRDHHLIRQVRLDLQDRDQVQVLGAAGSGSRGQRPARVDEQCCNGIEEVQSWGVLFIGHLSAFVQMV